MKSPLRAGLWMAALGLFALAAWSLTVWMTRPGPGADQARAGEAAKPAEPPMVVSMRKTDPGEEFFRGGWYDKAIAFWTESAAKGDLLAAHRLGVEYLDGKPGVVTRDVVKALEYHTAAAKSGDARSMFDIGTIHEFGMGVPKSLPEAFKWYKRSADYGHAQGQYNAGTMLEVGEGLEPDPVEAYKYFKLAAAQGFNGVPYDNRRNKVDSNMPTPVEALERKLTPEQKAEGEKKVAAFKALAGELKLD
jgi:TPR repeat protein